MRLSKSPFNRCKLGPNACLQLRECATLANRISGKRARRALEPNHKQIISFYTTTDSQFGKIKRIYLSRATQYLRTEKETALAVWSPRGKTI
jgi:hypothetical protein